MGVFGAIGGALKAPAKLAGKAVKSLPKPPGLGKPKPQMGGGMAGAIKNKMGIGPSPQSNPMLGAGVSMGQKMGGDMVRPSPVQMNPMGQNPPADGNPAMDSNYGGGFQPNPGTVGPQQAMGAGFSGMGNEPQLATGIGPSPQMMQGDPNAQGMESPMQQAMMGRRRQMMG